MDLDEVCGRDLETSAEEVNCESHIYIETFRQKDRMWTTLWKAYNWHRRSNIPLFNLNWNRISQVMKHRMMTDLILLLFSVFIL